MDKLSQKMKKIMTAAAMFLILCNSLALKVR